MKYVIKSQELKRELTFSCPFGNFIYVDLNNKPGIKGNILCKKGKLNGKSIPISCEWGGEDQFILLCLGWYKDYLFNNNI